LSATHLLLPLTITVQNLAVDTRTWRRVAGWIEVFSRVEPVHHSARSRSAVTLSARLSATSTAPLPRANGLKLKPGYLSVSFHSDLHLEYILISFCPIYIYRADPKTITNKLLVGYQGWYVIHHQHTDYPRGSHNCSFPPSCAA
jgi:hypothetical protein